MRRDEAMVRLPDVHRQLLDWLAEGADEATVADRLDLDPAAVPPLVQVAHSKLARLMDQPPPPLPGDPHDRA